MLLMKFSTLENYNVFIPIGVCAIFPHSTAVRKKLTERMSTHVVLFFHKHINAVH